MSRLDRSDLESAVTPMCRQHVKLQAYFGRQDRCWQAILESFDTSGLSIPFWRLSQCPVLLQPYLDPIWLPDGYTYERAAIERLVVWERGQALVRSPMTRQWFAFEDAQPHRRCRVAAMYGLLVENGHLSWADVGPMLHQQLYQQYRDIYPTHPGQWKIPIKWISRTWGVLSLLGMISAEIYVTTLPLPPKLLVVLASLPNFLALMLLSIGMTCSLYGALWLSAHLAHQVDLVLQAVMLQGHRFWLHRYAHQQSTKRWSQLPMAQDFTLAQAIYVQDKQLIAMPPISSGLS